MVNINLTESQAKLLYRAMVANDGSSICPHWSIEMQRTLDQYLDDIRGQILDATEKYHG